MSETTAPPTVIVRPAQPADADAMLSLIEALAHYEKLEPPDAAARARLVEDAFGPKPRFSVLLAELTGDSHDPQLPKIVGYAFLLETYSTFLALPTLYLEDLFVHPDCRGVGAGKVLFRAVAAEAERRGCGRVEFVVLDWNKLARDFYDRFGAEYLKEWCFYRVGRDRFDSIINSR